MQKKIIALAIAAAVSAPAYADNANITFYGKVDMNGEFVTTSNPDGTNANVDPTVVTAASTNRANQTRVATNASRFGLKGSEDLGGGLSAIYQYEITVDANGNGGNGFGAGTRNSQVGLKDEALGTGFIGNWDTPFKLAHNKIELFDNATFASATNLMGRSGATTQITAATAPAVAPVKDGNNVTSAAFNFNTRLKNTVQYWSPKIAGLDFKAAYGADNAALDSNTTSPAAVPVNKRVFSLSATYEDEMFYVSAANEIHQDEVVNQSVVAAAAVTANSGTGTNNATITKAVAAVTGVTGNNSAMRLVGAYKMGHDAIFGVTYETMSISTLVGPGVESPSRTNLELAGSYKMGAQKFGVSYAIAGDLGGMTDTGANQLSLRYGFGFSKRTEAYAMYTMLNNKTYGQYNFSAGNTLATAAGSKLTGLGFGVAHNF